MARQNEAKEALRVLHNHAEKVEEACSDNSGILNCCESNKGAINALTKHQLAYYVDNEIGVQVHTSVKRVIDRVTSRFRFRERHGELANQIDNLDHAVQSYRITKKDRYLDEIREIVIEINDALEEITSSFHRIIADEFSLISDVDEKIRQINRCKQEINKINDIFEHVKIAKLREWVQTDVNLEFIFLTILKSKIDSSLKDLNASNGKMIDMLATLQRDKTNSKLNQLIDLFTAQYHEDNSFALSLENIECLPSCLSQISTSSINAYANIDSELQVDELTDLAIKTINLSQKPQEQVNTNSIEIADVRDQVEEFELNEIDIALECLFEAIKTEPSLLPLSAVQSFTKFELDIEPKDWLLLVDGYICAQKPYLKNLVKIREKREMLLPYDGNIIVSDIIFESL